MKAGLSLRVLRVLNLIGFIIILYALNKMVYLTTVLNAALVYVK